MFFQLKELLRWLGLTVLEILLALIAFLAFTVLLVIKVEQERQAGDHVNHVNQAAETGGADAAGQLLHSPPAVEQGSLPWSVVFAPLYISDALNGYFVTVVLIRMYIEVQDNKEATPERTSL